jgi:hypothetical protein
MNFNQSHPIKDLSLSRDRSIIDHYISQPPKFSNHLLAYIIDFPDTQTCLCCGNKEVGVKEGILVVWVCHVCYKTIADRLVHIVDKRVPTNFNIETNFDPLNDYVCQIARDHLMTL